MRKFSDINLVRQELKSHMELDQFIILADKRYTAETGNKCDTLERVNDHLYKKRCDLDEHPIADDGTKDSTPSFTVCPPKELWQNLHQGLLQQRALPLYLQVHRLLLCGAPKEFHIHRPCEILQL